MVLRQLTIHIRQCTIVAEFYGRNLPILPPAECGEDTFRI